MPEGFSLGKLEGFQAHPEHIMDDANSTEPLNVAARVNDFVTQAQRLAGNIAGNDIMFTMGGGKPEDVARNPLLLLACWPCHGATPLTVLCSQVVFVKEKDRSCDLCSVRR